MKNILVVCENLNINATSAGIVSSTFIQLLSDSGYDVTVMTENNFDYPISWLPEKVKVVKFEIKREKKTIWNSIPKIKAIPAYFTGFSVTMRNRIEHYKIEINNQLATKNFDVIYALGVGNIFSPHFALAEMNLKIPFYVNIHDPFPMHVYPEPYKKSKTWISNLLEKKFKIVLHKAKGISFPSQFLLEHMSPTFPVIKEKGFVVPHIGTFLNNLPNDNQTKQGFAFNLSKINILHAGTLLGPRNPQFLLQSIAELNQEVPGFLDKMCFTFIGNVNTELITIVSNSESRNVHFINDRISYKKSVELIEQANASLVIEAISEFSPFLPGKVADIAYSEKPIISLSPKNSEVRRLLGTDYPYQSELNDVKIIKIILKKFFEDYKSNNVNISVIKELKKYVSIEYNSKVLKQNLN